MKVNSQVSANSSFLPVECSIDINEAFYGRRQVLADIEILVRRGHVVGLFGHNGAGKSTILNTAFGRLSRWSGRLTVDGRPLPHVGPDSRVRSGIILVPQGRGIFPSLTVEENFSVAWSAAKRAGSLDRGELERIYSLMPVIHDKWKERAGSLSGGQQQFVSVGRALLQGPKFLWLDEPSVGLAPKLVEDMLATVKEVSKVSNVGVLLVEQNVKQALNICERAYVVRSGRIVAHESNEELSKSDILWSLF